MSSKTGIGVPVISSVRWALVFAVVSRGAVLATVPIVLQRLGEETYAAWVVAGALIYSQGLLDFGAGSVAQRFIARAAADDSRHGVQAVARAAAWFYLGLSLAVGGLLLLLAPTIAGAIHGGGQDGTTVIRYAAVAFGATNVVALLAIIVEGCGRVDTSYRLQTVGAVFIVPVLLGSLEAGAGVHAIGLSWLAGPLLVSLLLGRAALREVRLLGTDVPSDFHFMDLVRLGGGVQVSSWADFASFQLPRVVAGVALPVGDLVSLDLALRLAQLVVFPLFAAFPVVLPLAVRADRSRGRPALQGVVVELQRAVTAAAALGVALCVPLAPPLIEAWTGRPSESFDVWITLPVLIGVAAHASTGVMSSALLAIGTVRTIVVYKAAQLALCLAVVAPASAIGVQWSAAALAVGMAGPAAWFLHRSQHDIGVRPAWSAPAEFVQLMLALVGVAGLTELVVLAAGSAPAVVTFVLAGLAGGAVLLGVVWLTGLDPRRLQLRLRNVLAVPADAPPVY